MKKFLKILIGSILGITIFIAFNLSIKREYHQTIQISRGESILKSSKELMVLYNPIFRMYLKFKNQGKNIKAGYYKLDGEYSMISLLDVFEKGEDELFKFVIPEGYTIKQIVNKLVKQGRITEEEFYKELENIKNFPYPTPEGNFEGYFYPATYDFPVYFKEKDIIKRVLSEFLRRFPVEKYPDKEDFYKKLILASIIEREAVKQDEKPRISSVFHNRLKIGMPLASDATINYIFDFSKKRIYYKDLKAESPYNTYKYKGLPPSPIANPNKKSVDAAYNPLDTEYLFFVAEGGGYHHFSKTYKEHLEFQRNNKKN